MNFFREIYWQLYCDFMDEVAITDYNESDTDYLYTDKDTCISYREAINDLINQKFNGDLQKALMKYTDSFDSYLKKEAAAILQKDAYDIDDEGRFSILPCVTDVEKPYCGYIELYQFLRDFQPQI